MKQLLSVKKYLLTTGLCLGMLCAVQAQRVRGGNNSERPARQAPVENRGGMGTISRERANDRQVFNQPGNRMSAPERSFPQRNISAERNTAEAPRSVDRTFSPQTNRNVERNVTINRPERNVERNINVDRSINVQRNNIAERNGSSNRYYDRGGNHYNNGNYSSRGNYPSHNNYVRYAPRHYYYVGAPRYSILPRTSIFINFGGYPYYYYDGLFYNYYGGYYQPVYAPYGIRVSVLPFGYMSFYVGPKRYYYYNGTYYLPYNNSDKEYEVVDAPLGAQLSELPKGAKSVYVNGEKFYEFNGTYYKKDVDSKGKEVYTVTGKNGEVNNTEEAPVLAGEEIKIGDVLPQLPDGSRSVMENGQQVFVAPNGTHFKLFSDGKSTGYQVTTLPDDKQPISNQEL